LGFCHLKILGRRCRDDASGPKLGGTEALPLGISPARRPRPTLFKKVYGSPGGWVGGPVTVRVRRSWVVLEG
jgi:hypothetical protein